MNERRLAATLAMRTNEQHAALEQTPAQGIAVVTVVGDNPQWLLLWTPRVRHAAPRFTPGCFRPRSLPPDWPRPVGFQRNTLAVDHHHPLRAFVPLGFADALAPFFSRDKIAGTKGRSRRGDNGQPHGAVHAGKRRTGRKSPEKSRQWHYFNCCPRFDFCAEVKKRTLDNSLAGQKQCRDGDNRSIESPPSKRPAR